MKPQYLITNRAFTTQNGAVHFGTDRNAKGLSYWTKSDLHDWQQSTANDFAQLAGPFCVFAHGFNNDDHKATDMGKVIADGLPDYIVVTFDWYSDGNVIAYEQDRVHARDSAQDFLDALRLLRRVKPACVIAHSMGNYLLQCALDAQVAYANSAGTTNIIHRAALVAADIDFTALKDSAFATLVQRGVVFYCTMDGALLASSQLHELELQGIARLGLLGPEKGSLPVEWEQHDCTMRLLHHVELIGKHSAYFFESWFYETVKQFFGEA